MDSLQSHSPTGSRWASLFFLFAGVTFVASCASGDGQDRSLQPAALSSRRLVTEGATLRDVLGRIVMLRGYNAGGRAKMPPFAPFDFEDGAFEQEADSFFAALARVGANVVRLTFSWEALEPTRGEYDMAYWARYRATVDAAHAHGIGVVVDFHQDVFASPFCGDGFPLWALGDIEHGPPRYDCGAIEWALPYFDSDSAVNQAFQRLWDDEDGLFGDFEDMWRFVAADLADHPGVAAFEVINEPGPGTGDPIFFETDVLPGVYERIGAIIQSEAGRITVLGGVKAGESSAQHHLALPELPDFTFAPHYYDAWAFLGLTNVNVNNLRMGITNAITLPGGRPEVPIVIGEFGMSNRNTAKARYLTAMLGIMDELQVHAIHWDAMRSTELWNGEYFSIFAPDGSENSWASAAVRPTVRAVAGESYVQAFDAVEVRYTLEVTGATEQVTEVYIPERHFGARPQLTVQGARYHFIAERETLVLAAAPGVAYSVEVQGSP